VVARNGVSVTEDDVTAFVAARVAKIKRLTGGVVFVDAIPKNAVCRGFLHVQFVLVGTDGGATVREDPA
jgi:hypothetical protein